MSRLFRNLFSKRKSLTFRDVNLQNFQVETLEPRVYLSSSQFERVDIASAVSSSSQTGFSAEETIDDTVSTVGGIANNGWATFGESGEIIWRFSQPQSVDMMRLFTGDDNSPNHDLGAYNLYFTEDVNPEIAGDWQVIPNVQYVAGQGTSEVESRINISGHQIRMNATGQYESSDTQRPGSIVYYTLSLDGIPETATGIKLSAVKANGLPNDGPGMAANEPGNFVLSEVQFFTDQVVSSDEDRVLFVGVNSSSYNGDGVNFYNTVVNAGALADYVLLSSPGQVASQLALNEYDQVWVYDLSSSSDGYTPDWYAIGDWYTSARQSGLDYEIITDGRIISSYWLGQWAGEGTLLSQNYYENVKNSDGGLFLGTDHNVFHSGINTINDVIGIERFSGNFRLNRIPVDTSHPLMTTPNDMGIDLLDNSSPGQTPFGLQPNGQILYSIAWHSGNVNTPGISTTITGGEVGFSVNIESPTDDLAVFDGETISFEASDTNGAGDTSYQWNSDIDGVLGTGSMLEISGLSIGRHEISVLAEDNVGGGADTDRVFVTVTAVADVTLSNVSVPQNVQPGEEIQISWTVTNQGSANTPEGWVDGIYWSDDNQFDASDLQIGTFTHDQIITANGDQRNVTTAASIPDTTDGDYWIFIVTNDGNMVTEYVTNNNISSAQPVALMTAVKIDSISTGDATNENVSTIILSTTDVLLADSAGEIDNYELVYLGSDRQPGGGDDIVRSIVPSYIEGSNEITVSVSSDNLVNLNGWSPKEFPGASNPSNWIPSPDGQSVVQHNNSDPSFYESDFDFIDGRFQGLMTVLNDSGDDDYMGLAFGYQLNELNQVPDNYYLMAWKKGLGNLPLRSGFFLIKVTNASALNAAEYHAQERSVFSTAPNQDGDTENIEILYNNSSSSSSSFGWQEGVEYEFDLRYQSDGLIDLVIRDTRNNSVVQEISVVDPDPIGSGKIAFYNRSQENIRYRGLQQYEFLDEGAYQLRVTSGDSAVRGVNGLALDGDADGFAGGDYVKEFVVDFTPPTIQQVASNTPQSITVNFNDADLVDVYSGSNPANYTLRSSGGDGTFNDGNEVDIQIDSIDINGNVTTLHFTTALPEDIHEITIGGVTDRAGNLLDGDADGTGGDAFMGQLDVDHVMPVVEIILDAASDSGVSNSDQLTNDDTPTFVITVNEPGVIAFDGDGDGTPDHILPVFTAGNYSFTSQSLNDGFTQVNVDFTPLIGDVTEATSGITIDTQGPMLSEYSAGSALSFDGNDYVAMPDSPSLRLTDQLTIEAWIKPESTNDQWPAVISKYAGSSHFESFTLNIFNNKLFFELTTSDNGNRHHYSTDDVIKLNEWQHVAVSWNGRTGLLHMYHNNILVQSFNNLTGTLVHSQSPATIGATERTNNPDNQFDGQIDELRVWNTSRSAEHISEHSHLQLTGQEQGLIGYWQVDEGAGNAVSDLTANSNHGTFAGGINSPAWMSSTAPVVDPDQSLTAPLSTQTFIFDEAIDPGSIDTSDLVIINPDGAGLGNPDLLSGSGDTWTATFNSLIEPGQYQFDVGPEIKDLAGNAMVEQGTKHILLDPDVTPPHITEVSPVGLINENVTQIEVMFSERINPTTFTASDVIIEGPSGIIDASEMMIEMVDETIFMIQIPEQSEEGRYEVSFGAGIADLAGNFLQPFILVDDNDFNQLPENWTFNGSSSWHDSGVIRLTGTAPGQAGSSFFSTPQAVAPFLVSFDFNMNNGSGISDGDGAGADGIVFVAAEIPNQGASGSGIGYQGYSGRSIAVEFDSYWNNTGDTNGDHIGIDWNGVFRNVQVKVPQRFIDTGTWHAKIQFDGSSLLEVDLYSPSGALTTLSYPIPAEAVPSQYTFGFTAGTGSAWSNHDVDNVQVYLLPENSSFSTEFVIDKSGARVVGVSAGGAVSGSIDYVDVTFDELIDETTLNSQAVEFTGPEGGIAIQQVIPIDEKTYRLTFEPQQQSGDYMINIGPGVLDLAGNEMDQDQNGINGEIQSDTFAQTLELLQPDLVASSVNTNDALVSGDPFTLNWQVSNTGDIDYSGVWAERVYVSSTPEGNDKVLLQTFNYNQPIQAGGDALLRSEVIDLPATSMNGDIYFIVEVDANQNIAELDEQNLFASSTYIIPPSLQLELSSDQITEGDGVVSGLLTRNGDVDSELVVSLFASDASQIGFPDTVTIPSGQYSARFDILALEHDVIDGDVNVSIQAVAGEIGGEAALLVIDANQPTLTITLPDTVLSEGELLTGTISHDVTLETDTIVNLSVSEASQFDLPLTATIPAGESEIQFSFTALDDTRVEATSTYSLSATAENHVSDQIDITVPQNDVPQLSIFLPATAYAEGAVGATVYFTVVRDVVTDRALTVALGSTGPDLISFPSTVTIPANQSSVTVPFSVLDDGLVNGLREIDLNAAVITTDSSDILTEGTATSQISILDNDGPTLTVKFNNDFIYEGASTLVTVSRNTAVSAALIVNLSTTHPEDLAIPSSIEIPAGETEYSFTINAPEDDTTDGDLFVSLTASLEGYNSGSDSLLITDTDLPDLIITSAAFGNANAVTGESVSVDWTIVNNGFDTAENTWTQRVFISSDAQIGNDVLVGQYTYSGPLMVGDQYTRSANVRMPNQPGEYWLVVQTDVNGTVNESLETNNTFISSEPINVVASLTASVSSEIEVAPTGTPIPLNGQANRPDGSPAAFKQVSVHVSVRGTNRILTAITDAAGEFETTFTPLPGEGGVYSISATHPGVESNEVQDQFTLISLAATPASRTVNLIEDRQSLGSIALRNLADVPITGLTAEVIDAPENFEVNVSLANSTQIDPLSTLSLEYTLTATDASVLRGPVKLRVSSAEAPPTDITLNVNVTPLRAKLATNPGSLSAGMVRGGQTLVEFQLTNQGGIPTGPLTLSLPSQYSWLKAVTPLSMPSLDPGQSTQITLQLLAPEDLQLTAYNGSMAVNGTDVGLSIPFSFRALTDNTGDLQIRVEDEYTYFAEDTPLLEGATVTITDAITNQTIATATTDATGMLLFPDLREGYYNIITKAEDHNTDRQTLLIEPGDANELTVFLPRQTVTYNWTVTPTEIEDRTEITLETRFETNVPAPVVTTNINKIDFSQFDRYQGAMYSIEIELTNHGYIAADNLRFADFDHPSWTITPLVSEVGTLPAKTSITIPVTIEPKFSTIKFVSNEVVDFDTILDPTANNAISSPLEITQQEPGNTTAPEGVLNLWEIQNDYLINNDITELAFPVANDHYGNFLGPRGWDGDPSKGHTKGTPIPIADGPTKYWPPGSLASDKVRDSHTYDSMLSNSEDNIKKAIEDYLCFNTPLNRIKTDRLSFYNPIDLVTSLDLVYAFGGMRGDGDGTTNFPYAEVVSVDSNTGTDICGNEVIEYTAKVRYYQFDIYDWKSNERPSYDLQQNGWGSRFYVYVTTEETITGVVQCDPDATCGPCDLTWGVIYNYLCGPNSITKEAKIYLSNLSDNCDGDLPTVSDRTYVVDNSEKKEPRSYINTVAVINTTRCLPEGGGTENTLIDSFGNIIQSANNTDPGVCAQVVLQLDQDAVLTGNAFDARLELSNLTDENLRNIGVNVKVTDASGNDVSDLFDIRTPSLSNISGVDGSGIVSSGETGIASWIIVPATDAAIDGVPTEYYVSGTMSYTEHSNDVTIPLSEVPITVHPQAELELDYFLQRDVISDDPFTAEIESAEPFTLGVLVNNKGYGAARDLQIESAQPRIIENEKGLLVDFQIIGTSVNGMDVQRSLTANFGTIEPSTVASGEWLMESTLQGLFVDYNASFRHVSSLGDSRFSQIKSVEIHEMIRPINAAQVDGGDGLNDYLVNDLEDPNDLPDTLYLSDGTISEVGLGSNASFDDNPSLNDLRIEMAADMPEGWGYLKVNDPSNGGYELVSVLRSDGTALPIENFWQTDRTFIGEGQRPILEDNIHLVDYQSTGEYTLVFSNGDETGPVVLGFVGVNTITQAAVDVIDVVFDEVLLESSFDVTDLTLSINGDSAELGQDVQVTPTGGTMYRIAGLASLTGGDAVYELSVDLTGIKDQVGNTGIGQAGLSWVKGESAPAVIGISGVPSGLSNSNPGFIDIEFTQPIDLDTLTFEDVSLTLNQSELLDESIMVTQVSANTYRVSNLQGITNMDGEYQFVIDASNVMDMDGVSGFGVSSATWTHDATAPELIDVIDVTTNPRNIAVQQVDLVFSKPINLSSFDVNDFSLTRDDLSVNLIEGDDRVTIEHQYDNTYRVSGLSWVQAFVADPQVADFTFSVDSSGIMDLAGNVGDELQSTSWTIDLDSPAPVMNLQLETFSGIVSNGRVNSLFAEISGQLGETGLTVSVTDLTTGGLLFDDVINDTSFDVPIEFPSPGRHNLEVKLVDAAGNVTRTLLPDLFVSDTPPNIDEVTGVPLQPVNDSLDELTVRFVSPINAASLTYEDLRITRDGGVNLVNSSIQIQAIDGDQVFAITGLSGITGAEGQYQLSIDLSGISNPYGNVGMNVFGTSWINDTTAPQSMILSVNQAQTNRMVLMNIVGQDPDDASLVAVSGIDRYEVYVSVNGSDYSLYGTVPGDSPSVVIAGEVGNTYAAYSLAYDHAGNAESHKVVPDVRFTLYNPVRGDLNNNIVVEQQDIDLLRSAVVNRSSIFRNDMNLDRQVNSDDMDYLVHAILGTEFGDANLDGKVDAIDLSILATHYGTSEASWAKGDFNGDRMVNVIDLAILNNHYRFTSHVPYDMNFDRQLDSNDIVELRKVIKRNDQLPYFDVNQSGENNSEDVDYLIRNVLGSEYGDANLDGVVDLEDLTRLANSFGSKTQAWSQGDFNGDGRVNLIDLSILASNFNANQSNDELASIDLTSRSQDSSFRPEAIIDQNHDDSDKSDQSMKWDHIGSLLDDEQVSII